METKWEVVKIEDICELGRGRVINHKYIDENQGEYPVYSSQTQNEGIMGYINTFDFEGEYVTWTTDGIYAGTCFYRTGKFNCTNVCGTLKSKNENRLIIKFLPLVLNDITPNHVVKSANPKLMNNVMANIKIPLPPLSVQQQIVSECEAIDKAVAVARITEEEGRKEIEEKVGNVFEQGYVSKKLIEVTTKIGSGATPLGGESSYKKEGITLVRSQNIYDEGFTTKGLVFIDDEQAEKLNNVTVKEGDILFNITGASVARCCLMDKDYLPARVNQHVVIIRVTDEISNQFLRLLLINNKSKEELLTLAGNSMTREAITKAQLENYKIPVPPLPQQTQLVAEIEEIEARILAAKQVIAQAPAQKQAVMKRYL